MDIEGILAITLIFGGATAFLLAISPIGRAVAERIRGQASTSTDPQLLADVDALRHDVAELQERVDFTERLLARREQGQVGEGGKAG
jgi:ubiquinone biosynthesis protein UbiJ